MPHAYFDNYAPAYDDHFSESIIGIAQRQIVHACLEEVISPTRRALEINCGTGVDAVFLAPRCQEVLCTDISQKMVEVATAKTNQYSNCTVVQSAIQDLDRSISNKYHLIFSNFGGLNCIDANQMQYFSASCGRLSSDSSDLVFVIMGKKCLWERFYFCVKGDFKKAFRRRSEVGVKSGEGTSEFTVYYYSPRDIENIFSANFTVVRTVPVGFFIPPSYLNPYFIKRTFLFSVLKKLDRVFQNFSFLSNYADHYLIHLKRK